MRHSRPSVLSASLIALGALALSGSPARANLVLNAASFPTPQADIDFNQFTGPLTGTNGPIQVGNALNSVTLTSTSAAQAVVGAAFFGLGDNGHWDSAKTGFVGLNGQGGALTFNFDDGPVSSIGGFFDYSPNVPTDPVTISALAADGTVLESYDMRSTPISTPGGVDAGAFRGIVRNTADIAALRLTNAFFVVDDLQLSRATASVAAPEPGTFAFALVGVPPLCFVLRRRTAKRSLR